MEYFLPQSSLVCWKIIYIHGTEGLAQPLPGQPLQEYIEGGGNPPTPVDKTLNRLYTDNYREISLLGFNPNPLDDTEGESPLVPTVGEK